MRLTASGISVPGTALGITSLSTWLGTIRGKWDAMMEPRRYGQDASPSKPLWRDTLDNYGPSLTLAGVLLAVLMGWVPSKLMDSVEKNNLLLGTLTAGADAQRELTSTVKDLASTIKDQSNTIKELRLLLARQIEWNQDQCRLLRGDRGSREYHHHYE